MRYDININLLMTYKKGLNLLKPTQGFFFVDFPSAFNTIQPLMMRKVFDMNVNCGPTRVAWIHSYLTLRPQYVKLNGAISYCICH